MIVYRIAATQYANSLMASGRSGRWNLADQYVIYASGSRSLATLEVLVNRSGIHPSSEYKVMVIELPDSFQQIEINHLPDDWRELSYYPHLQMLGGRWYETQESLVLSVPSVVVSQESNFIINTHHKEFGGKAKLLRIEDYFWDERLEA